MRFADKHVAMAVHLANRQGGVTAKELAAVIRRSERLAKEILNHLASAWRRRYVFEDRPSTKPGRSPRALIAVEVYDD